MMGWPRFKVLTARRLQCLHLGERAILADGSGAERVSTHTWVWVRPDGFRSKPMGVENMVSVYVGELGFLAQKMRGE